MRFIKMVGPNSSADDWVLWCILWACAGLLAGGLAILISLAVSVPR